MGVLVEAETESGSKKLKLAEAWRRAIENRQKSREQRP
jgi:hypothetical protein